jgi:hypothetical protein
MDVEVDLEEGAEGGIMTDHLRSPRTHLLG